jgi:molecular chaperone IbpA
MTTLNFAPLYRSTVGYDRLFDMLGNSIRPDWPPYNIEKKDENAYRITMAVAGFTSEEIELTQHGGKLLVAGQKKAAQGEHQMLHQGIASRDFTQTFSLADHVKVESAALENGLLSIDLVREVPEELKPRKIDISIGGSKLPTTGSKPMEISQEKEVQAQAA